MRAVGGVWISAVIGVLCLVAMSLRAAEPVAAQTPATAPASDAASEEESFQAGDFRGGPNGKPLRFQSPDADGVPRRDGFYKLRFQTQVVEKDGDSPLRITMAYVLYLPKGYEAGKGRCPTLIFLHGAGEGGTDGNAIFGQGPAKELRQQAGTEFANEFPFIMICPQCPPRGQRWDQPRMLKAAMALLDDLQTKLRIDRDRIYITGLSMGGKGTWLLAMQAPARFAAIAPIVADTLDLEGARHLSVISGCWAIDGELDFNGAPENNRKMVDTINAAGGHAQLTIVPNEGHHIWQRFYSDPTFYEWFLKYRREAKDVTAAVAPSE